MNIILQEMHFQLQYTPLTGVHLQIPHDAYTFKAVRLIKGIVQVHNRYSGVSIVFLHVNKSGIEWNISILWL